MGGGDYNAPTPPSYGEGMREALEAQVALLAGTEVGEADFSQFPGGLRELVREYEAPLRRETAQIDTDVLRQTLLGTERKVERVEDPNTGEVKFGIRGAEVVLGEDGEPTTLDGGRYEVLQTSAGRKFQKGARRIANRPNTGSPAIKGLQPTFQIFDNVKGVFVGDPVGGEEFGDTVTRTTENNLTEQTKSLRIEINKQFRKLRDTIDEGKEVATEFSFTNPNTGKPLEEGEVVREGDGMIDLLGDRRNIMETRRLSRDERGLQLVEQNPELSALYEGAQNDPTNPFYGLTKQQAGRKLLDDNNGDLQKISEQFGIGNLTAPQFANVDTGRQAGFDEQGNFLGLSALAEDVQRANLSRQREADLADVERLSNRFQDVMADFRPGTTEALAGAREVLEAQRQRLIGQPASGQVDKSPLAVLNQGFREIEEDYQSTLDQYGPEAADAVRADAMNKLQAQAATAGLTMDQVQAGPQAQPAQLTGFQDPTFRAETQLTGDAGLLGVLQSATQADVDAERATRVGETIQVDPLRARLIRDARDALGEGLTEREERQIAEAERARATMMGRTFDKGFGIAEAQARVREDNQRRMQNRAFASQILGQEAGLQSGDLGRAMQQELRQVGADMDAERLRQAQTAGFIDASTRLAGLEASTTMDPFAALLNRAGGGSLGQAGQVFGQAQYGLASGPQFLNPEAGLGFISQMAANEASMYGAQQQANAARSAGLMQGLGAIGGGFLSNPNLDFCWVAREVYGPLNPQWLQFREWMLSEAPNWFYHLYLKFGERFANWISDKPRIKAIIRRWMDTKIRG